MFYGAICFMIYSFSLLFRPDKFQWLSCHKPALCQNKHLPVSYQYVIRSFCPIALYSNFTWVENIFRNGHAQFFLTVFLNAPTSIANERKA